MYDYKAKEEDEIDLKKGQILTQMKPGDDQGKNRAFLKDPDGEIENSESIFEIRISNFCYIQVIVFDLKSYLPVATVET